MKNKKYTQIYNTVPGAAFVDISEPKKAQKELDKTQKKLAAAIEHAGLAYWEYDIANNRAYLNTISTTEYTLDEVLENYPESLYETGAIHQDSIELYDSLVQAVRHGEPTVSAEIKTIDANGDLVWKRVRFTTLFDQHEKPYWAVATAESINEYKELENHFQTVLDQNKIDTWLFDLPRHTIIQNNNTANIYGVHTVEIPNVPEDLIAKKLCHPDDAENFREFYNKLYRGEQQVSIVMRLWDARTDKYVWKRCTYTILPNKDEKLMYALGSAVEVTDQMEVKQKYEDAIKYRYNTMSENVIIAGHCNISHNIMVEIDDKTGCDLANCFGRKRDDFFRGIGSLIPNEEQKKAFLKIFSNENERNSFDLGITQHNYECTIKLGKEQGIRWITTHVDTALQPETNELIGYLTITDVSASKMQEQVLDSVIHFDYDYVAHLNFKNDAMVFYNSKSQSTQLQGYKYGISYPYTAVTKSTSEAYVTKEDKEHYLEQMSIKNVIEQLKYKDSYEVIYHFVGDDGEIRTKQARFAVHDRAAGIAVFSRTDVTDMLAQQEKQKIALTESLAIAKQANNSKSKFLSSMSHDIRTPMNAIVGMCNLAIEDEENKQQTHESLQVIQQSSRLLLSMINDILDMNRIESGKMILTKETFSVTEQMEVATRRARGLASKKDQTIEVYLNITHDCCIGDVVRIHRVFDNFLSNAHKFTNDGGRISYRITESPLENKNIGLYKFEISDNGIGMTEEQQDHIFEPFYRVENSMTSQTEGSGLGLPITKSIVDYMGGTISVDSKLGIGTTFTIELPFRFGQEILQKKELVNLTESYDKLRGARVILCEDHPVNQIVATRILEKKGIIVTVANNGKEGYEIFEKSSVGTYAAILMDIQMPIMNGYVATHKIRKCNHSQAKTIPIIAMTANAFTEDIQKSIDSGMNYHLAKPIEPKQLYDILQIYLQ